MKISLLSTGSALPEKIVDNFKMSEMVETSDEWITERTGIKRRRFVTQENAHILGLKASERAIKKANLKKSDIDLIICATITPDVIVPSAASNIRKELGIERAVAFDINAACCGFIYAVDIAKSMMLTGGYKNALIVGTEVLSKITDFTDRSTCVLFGDGAGAAILARDGQNEIIASHIEGISDVNNVLVCDNFAIDTPFYTGKKPADTKLKMDGQQVFRFAVNAMTDSIEQVLKKAEKSISDVKYFIPHQANNRIIEYAASKLKIEKERFYLNLQEVGNTSAASIPIALDKMLDKVTPQKGDLMLMVGFGGGLTAGSILIQY